MNKNFKKEEFHEKLQLPRDGPAIYEASRRRRLPCRQRERTSEHHDYRLGYVGNRME
jgi:hypothetical protein